MTDEAFWRNLDTTAWRGLLFFSWFGLTGVTGAILNAGICFLFWTQRRLRNTGNLFFISLAVVDILVGTLVIPWKLLFFVLGPSAWWLTCLASVVDYVLCLSFLSICALTYDRYQAILYPLTYLVKMTFRNAWRVLLVTWMLPSVNLLRLIWMLSQNMSFEVYDGAFYIFLFTVMLIATGAVLFAYYRIFRAANVQEHHIREANLRIPQTHDKFQIPKAIKSCLCVTICFVCCWLPRGSYFIARNFHSSPSYQYDLITFGLMCSSSALNPIIYSISNREVRRTLKALLWNRCIRAARLKKEISRATHVSSLRTTTATGVDTFRMSSQGNRSKTPVFENRSRREF